MKYYFEQISLLILGFASIAGVIYVLTIIPRGLICNAINEFVYMSFTPIVSSLAFRLTFALLWFYVFFILAFDTLLMYNKKLTKELQK